jgi:flagellar motor switch protein FliN/FliY
MSDPVDYVPFETTIAAQPAVAPEQAELERLYDVPVELAVEIGRTRMTIRETLALGPGSIVSLDRLAGDPVDLLVNGKPIARGEVVVIDEEFGLRVTEVTSPVTSPNPGVTSPNSGVTSPNPGGPGVAEPSATAASTQAGAAGVAGESSLTA